MPLDVVQGRHSFQNDTEKLDFLLERYYATRSQLASLGEEIRGEREVREAQDRKLDRELREHIPREIDSTLSRDKRLRYLGFFLLAVGIICGSIANLL
jgi:hypothetical protein